MSSRADIDALCRQIDVRKQLDADPAFALAVIEQLLEQASTPAADGWNLKCANSALKALDLRPDLENAGQLRIRAIEVLERRPV
jgi:hypothetical protein